MIKQAVDALKRAGSAVLNADKTISTKLVDKRVQQIQAKATKDDTNEPNYHDKARTFIKDAKSKGYSVGAEGSELIATPSYHEKAQAFIKSAKENGYSVKSEGSELIAHPPAKASKPFPAPAVMNVGRRIVK